MDIALIHDSPMGTLVPIVGEDANGTYEHYAFLPAPLPPVPDLTPQTWNQVAGSMEALGRLRQACAQLPNPGLLIAPALAREAADTSALEGTFAPLAEILEARLEPGRRPSPEVAEIRGYERMAWEAFEWVAERPITINFLCAMHKILAAEARRPIQDPGRVREHQVIIGPEGSSMADARFVPPPGDDRLRTALGLWEDWVQAEHAIPSVLQAAMAHYQFETIHPFEDGNGRIGRLVIVLQLLRAGTIPAPVLTVSPWLLRHRNEYQDHLLKLSQSGDWNPWVTFFCEAIRTQAENHVDVIDSLVTWLAEVRELIHDHHWSGTIARIAEDLIEWPVITMMFAASNYNVSVPTAKSAIDRLVEVGVLRELTGRTYNRIFGATEIIRLVESL